MFCIKIVDINPCERDRKKIVGQLVGEHSSLSYSINLNPVDIYLHIHTVEVYMWIILAISIRSDFWNSW
jgi:hypothetical protein